MNRTVEEKRILDNIKRLHKKHWGKPIKRDTSSDVIKQYNDIRKRKRSIFDTVQYELLYMMYTNEIKEGYEDYFSIFHNLPFEKPKFYLRRFAELVINDVNRLPQELILLKNMQESTHKEYMKKLKPNVNKNTIKPVYNILVNKLSKSNVNTRTRKRDNNTGIYKALNILT